MGYYRANSLLSLSTQNLTRSSFSFTADEVIEYAETEQYVVAPTDAWFYLVAGNKVASISSSHLLEKGADGASVHLVVQKRFSSAERHALVELQLWKLVDSFIINRLTGLYLTATSEGTLIISAKVRTSYRQLNNFSKRRHDSLPNAFHSGGGGGGFLFNPAIGLIPSAVAVL